MTDVDRIGLQADAHGEQTTTPSATDDATSRARLSQQLQDQLQELQHQQQQQQKQMAFQNQLQLASRSLNKRKNFQPKNIQQVQQLAQ